MEDLESDKAHLTSKEKILYETYLIVWIKRENELSQSPAKKLPALERFCKGNSSKMQVDNWLNIRLMELSFKFFLSLSYSSYNSYYPY